MEGLRGFAVLLVFFVHYADLVHPWIAEDEALLALADALATVGNSGVDLFFVLSGYVIYGSVISRYQPFVPFLARRIERIYPAFTTVFALYFALSFVFPAENKIPESPGDGALYLLQNFLLLPGLFPIKPMITVAWSLSYELFYYIAIPVLVAAFKLRRRSPTWRAIFFVALAATFAAYTALNDGPVRLLMFVAGIVLFEAIHHSRLRPSSIAGLVALFTGLLSMLLPVAGPAGTTLKVAILGVTFFVLCLACFRTPHSWLPRAFAWTPLRWLGNMSYSYYLLHGLALNGAFLALSKVMPPTGQDSTLFWLLLPPMLALTLLASALLFLLIERPFSLAPRRKRDAPRLPHAASASESGS
ncbi:MAG TPA: acyltransferase [Steroidobacter sp.]|uniref:acyltransferase family protein n=1 Tax=Steroidobacter sp. TaxID=1978227 RepID=UPI002EDB6367